jgi:hypothetical protein
MHELRVLRERMAVRRASSLIFIDIGCDVTPEPVQALGPSSVSSRARKGPKHNQQTALRE